MARADLLEKIMSKGKSALDFNWNQIVAPPIGALLSNYDISLLGEIVRDKKLNANILKKIEYMDQVLNPRGFARLGGGGTNRRVYKFLDDQSFLLKLATSKPGLDDAKNEMYNQYKYGVAPFCTKVFEATPCGTMGLFERVNPITSVRQFNSVADDIFDVIDYLIGNLVIADIGNKFFMNWGLRSGFGPVLLDFPLVYEFDITKAYCSVPDFIGNPCGGAIDYDPGYNFLYCKKCGKQHQARELAKGDFGMIKVINNRKAESKMKISVEKNNEVIVKESVSTSDVFIKKIKTVNKKDEFVSPAGVPKPSGMKVSVNVNGTNVTKNTVSAVQQPAFSSRKDNNNLKVKVHGYVVPKEEKKENTEPVAVTKTDMAASIVAAENPYLARKLAEAGVTVNSSNDLDNAVENIMYKDSTQAAVNQIAESAINILESIQEVKENKSNHTVTNTQFSNDNLKKKFEQKQVNKSVAPHEIPASAPFKLPQESAIGKTVAQMNCEEDETDQPIENPVKADNTASELYEEESCRYPVKRGKKKPDTSKISGKF